VSFKPAEARRLVEQALLGEPITASTLRQLLHYYDVPDYKDGNFSTAGAIVLQAAVRGISSLLCDCFRYKGWIIFMDEVESIALMGKSRRLKNYELLHDWVDTAPGALIPVFAVTPDFLHKMVSDGATRSPELWRRHTLSEPPPEEWASLCGQLTALHAGAYAWAPPAALDARLKARVDQSVGRELRLRLKLLVSELDLTEQEQADQAVRRL
jgi:hypothetical protein